MVRSKRDRMVCGLTHINILSTQLYTHSLLFNHLLTVPVYGLSDVHDGEY